jgi:hypothetical protein
MAYSLAGVHADHMQPTFTSFTGVALCVIQTLQLPEHISSMDVADQDSIMYFCGTVLEALRLKSMSEYMSCTYCMII